MEQIPTEYLQATDGTCEDGYTDCRFGVCLLTDVPARHDSNNKLISKARFLKNTKDILQTAPATKDSSIPRNTLFIPEVPADLSQPVPAGSLFRVPPDIHGPRPGDLLKQMVLHFNQVTPGEHFDIRLWVESHGGNSVIHVERGGMALKS
jgi:hypothetical protein